MNYRLDLSSKGFGNACWLCANRILSNPRHFCDFESATKPNKKQNKTLLKRFASQPCLDCERMASAEVRLLFVHV